MATKTLSPDLAVRIAWALTGEWSETPSVREEATVAKARVKALEDLAQASDDPQEKEYVPKAVDHIKASQRSLANVYAARKLNFEEAQKMRASQMQQIESYSRLTANWQSAWPRVMSVGLGGSAGALTLTDLLKETFKSVNPAVLQALLFVIGATLLYLLNEFFVLPWVRRRIMMENVRWDYDRNLYYDQFVDRTKGALISLYLDVDRAHLKSFGSPYDPNANAAQIVTGALAGVPSTMCPKVHPHMNQGVITPNLWSMCETGQGKEDCPHWDK